MQLMMKKFLVIFISLSILAMAGCGGTKVARKDVNETIDLSGAWNDSDSRLVSTAMIDDMLDQRWLRNFTKKKRKPPTVIVGRLRNLSHEHINLNTFIADIERAMVNSGEVDFVASRSERDDIRDERKDQDLHASEKTRKAMGQEAGADFMLKGTINTIIDAQKRTQVRFYQVDLTLISLTNNRKVWVGQKKIKKLVEGSNLRY